MNRSLIAARMTAIAGVMLIGVLCDRADRVVSPFFLSSEIISDPEYPTAPLFILAGGETVETDTCRIETSPADSVVFVDVAVSPLTPERIQDRYKKILLEVSVGIKATGLVVADTSGIELPGPGNYPLVLKVKNASALSAGDNSVAVIAITRYLDGDGYLAAPMGRRLRYCNLRWQ